MKTISVEVPNAVYELIKDERENPRNRKRIEKDRK